MRDFVRCPEIDRLGRELVEAYRRIDDCEIFCFSEDGEIAIIHRRMAEHRSACPTCNEAVRIIESEFRVLTKERPAEGISQ